MSIKKCEKKFEVQPFSYYATHLNELEAVLQAHYDGKIDLSTIWSKGDTMENISQQNIDLVILDFNKVPLSSDTSKKAAITIGGFRIPDHQLTSNCKIFGTNYSMYPLTVLDTQSDSSANDIRGFYVFSL